MKYLLLLALFAPFVAKAMNSCIFIPLADPPAITVTITDITDVPDTYTEDTGLLTWASDAPCEESITQPYDVFGSGESSTLTVASSGTQDISDYFSPGHFNEPITYSFTCGDATGSATF